MDNRIFSLREASADVIRRRHLIYPPENHTFPGFGLADTSDTTWHRFWIERLNIRNAPMSNRSIRLSMNLNPSDNKYLKRDIIKYNADINHMNVYTPRLGSPFYYHASAFENRDIPKSALIIMNEALCRLATGASSNNPLDIDSAPSDEEEEYSDEDDYW